MVHFSDPGLDHTFAALADPSRRAILAELSARGPLSAGELARPFAVSLPAVLKHIDVLRRAGLVRREKVGRVVRCSLEAAPMRKAMVWLETYERFWSERLDALAAYVEQAPDAASPPAGNPDPDANNKEQEP